MAKTNWTRKRFASVRHYKSDDDESGSRNGTRPDAEFPKTRVGFARLPVTGLKECRDVATDAKNTNNNKTPGKICVGCAR